MGPHLGKLVNMHTLNLACTLAMYCAGVCCWCLTCCGMCALCEAGNKIGDEGAVAMGPHLGKLANMHTLNLACTLCDVLRWCLLLVCDMLWYVCIVRGREWHRC